MAGNIDAAAHLRFLATVRRQSAPPRCNPFVIVLQVGNNLHTLTPVICTFYFHTYKLHVQIKQLNRTEDRQKT